MILITGGYGFIGSNLINKINSKFIVIEDLNKILKRKFYIKNKKKIVKVIDWRNFNINKLNKFKFSTCIHLGAISNTLENNKKKIKEHNILFSKKIYRFCEKNKIDLIYASSASVYGDGKFGYDDLINIKIQNKLKPLNLYGNSKLLFDKFILKAFYKTKLNKLVGLRFFNVYGINEYHKLGQCSPIYKFFYEIKKKNKPILYSDFAKNKLIERDFIYIDDVVLIIKNLLKMNKIKTIINVGTSKPRTFKDIAEIICNNLKKKEIILRDLPKLIKKNYQYRTCSNNKLIKKYKLIFKFTTLESGIKKYINLLNK